MGLELMQLVFGIGLVLVIVALINKLVFKPARIVFKLTYSMLLGIVFIWGFNYFGGFWGYYLPANLATILTAGFLGIPGLALMMLLQLVV
jgi:inhibitor of the pro-sigma K processing machinery